MPEISCTSKFTPTALLAKGLCREALTTDVFTYLLWHQWCSFFWQWHQWCSVFWQETNVMFMKWQLNKNDKHGVLSTIPNCFLHFSKKGKIVAPKLCEIIGASLLGALAMQSLPRAFFISEIFPRSKAWGGPVMPCLASRDLSLFGSATSALYNLTSNATNPINATVDANILTSNPWRTSISTTQLEGSDE